MEHGALISAPLAPIVCIALMRFKYMDKSRILEFYPFVVTASVIVGGAVGGTIGLVSSISNEILKVRLR